MNSTRVVKRDTYRTKDGRADYTYSFEQQPNGTWRVYIENQPGYGERLESGETTHRYADGTRKYICWTAPIKTESDARKIAEQWADLTQRYIHTGQRF